MPTPVHRKRSLKRELFCLDDYNTWSTLYERPKVSCCSYVKIAERLSVRQLIVQCGLKSQLAYIYICAQLLSRLGMQLNFRLRSLYMLLLCRYVPYTCCYYIYICNKTLLAPGGASTRSRWRPDELHGCRLCTSDARRIRDLDKPITSFYPGRLTTAPTRLEFV